MLYIFIRFYNLFYYIQSNNIQMLVIFFIANNIAIMVYEK
jgi:hypothetical protein